ncbi:MAG: dihydroorotase [Clostridiales bacterium GWF2_38_85]|nr:MAG: dihydroorotase [Clostridiales bacterium GWF2_38_85]HBL83711.1 dihydroorotase [Clostridiales bacterium]
MIFKNARIYIDGRFCPGSLAISKNSFTIFPHSEPIHSGTVFDFNNLYIIPGFSDVHVHLREPGFSYKETIKSGTTAAAASGYTAVCTMPNLNPVPDSYEALKLQLDIIKRDAKIAVYPYGTITKGQNGKELSDMDAMAEFVIGFSDDGRGVQSEEMMIVAMKKIKSLDKILAAHCEDNSLLKGGVIHDGRYAEKYGYPGICSASEFMPIQRDLKLVEQTECRYHVCHISTKESVQLIREAKRKGLPVTCETAPHYLILCEDDLHNDGRFKMNPPLRSAEDRQALLEGLADGTIDVIATDHAPHSADEKSKGLFNSNMGVTGLECAFPILYTELVLNQKVISLEKLIDLMSCAPDRIFGIKKKADFAVLDLDKQYTINPAEFLSMGRSTPFDGRTVKGKNIMTIKDGEIIWSLTER